MAQMLPRLDLSAGERRTVVALLFEYLDDPSQIVKTCSMQALFDLSKSDAKLLSRVVPILHTAVATGGGATRSRAKRLLAQLV